MSDKIEIGKKSNLEPGYVYIPITTSSVISEYTSKNVSRKRKINKIFGLALDIKDEFSPRKSVLSRYSKKIVKSKYYGTVEIKNPL
jgi:hypothetical protein